MPGLSSKNKTLVIKVENSVKADMKVFLPCPVLLDFFFFFLLSTKYFDQDCSYFYYYEYIFLYYFLILVAKSMYQVVLVITYLGGKFGINCPSTFLKILKLPEVKRRQF